jgi:hypothetical protein
MRAFVDLCSRTVFLKMRLLDLYSPLLLCASWGTAALARVEELLPKLELSPTANVYLRGENGYTRLVKRWQIWRSPDFAAVVEVATSEDVKKTVCYHLHTIILQSTFRAKYVRSHSATSTTSHLARSPEATVTIQHQAT